MRALYVVVKSDLPEFHATADAPSVSEYLLCSASGNYSEDDSQYETCKSAPKIVGRVNHLVLLNKIHDYAHNGEEK